MTTPKPKPAEHSEEELLEQWDFLDRLVERQAAQLRAGIQDAEEADASAAGLAEVDGLRQDLDRLRAELLSAEAARAASAVRTSPRRRSSSRRRSPIWAAPVAGSSVSSLSWMPARS